MTSRQSDLLSHVPAFPGDPILSLMEGFQADPRPNKVSLSIGLYFDAHGQVPLLPSVRRAEPRCCSTTVRAPTCPSRAWPPTARPPSA
jgi:aspartate/tyrosine/aromatic aminotransferase